MLAPCDRILQKHLRLCSHRPIRISERIRYRVDTLRGVLRPRPNGIETQRLICIRFRLA